MKTRIILIAVALLLAGATTSRAQDWPEEYLGLPGDNLNLYAVMNLFRNSETLEIFERELNNSDNMINNLDLNGDNYVDYIMVLDYTEGNIHNIVLRVAMNEREHQDVAVFVVEKLRDGAVTVQLIGDEALYGKNYIVEPVYAETPNPGYKGNVTKQKVKTRRNVTVVKTTYYEVASWPVIVYISRPNYVVWRSSWSWGYYPVYWHAWTPHYWHYYYGYHYNWYNHYYVYYRPWRQPRCVHYHTVYYTRVRNYSPTVVVNINNGSYKQTYSRPEKRSEGERFYAQRQATGGNVPPGRTAVGSGDSRQGSRTNVEATPRTSRPTTEGRNTNVQDSRQGTVSRPRNEGTAGRGVTATPERNVRNVETGRTTPRREESATPSRQSSPQPRRQETVTPSRERQEAPPRNVERSAPDRKQVESRSTPSVSGRNESRPKAVERSQPSRTESRPSGNVKSSGQESRSKSTGTVRESSSRSQEKSKSSESNSGRTRGR